MGPLIIRNLAKALIRYPCPFGLPVRLTMAHMVYVIRQKARNLKGDSLKLLNPCCSAYIPRLRLRMIFGIPRYSDFVLGPQMSSPEDGTTRC